MKKYLMIPMLLLILLSITGCIRYGKGETIGYVYAIDDGILWDKVWYKSNLESSESDCYLVRDDLWKQQLRKINGKQKVKLYYDRHLFTASICPAGTGTGDEITKVEILE